MEFDGSHDGYNDGSFMPDTSAAEAALKKNLSRKRTKTGCLTCRKRRIKCGEERPVCNNCIKSKRHCEGYSQRVVFRPPTFDYQPIANGAAHITFQSVPVSVASPHHGLHDPALDSSSYAHLRPRPVEQPHPVTAYNAQTQQYVVRPVPKTESLQGFTSQPVAQHWNHQSQQPTASFAPDYVVPDPYRHQHLAHGHDPHKSAHSFNHFGSPTPVDPALQLSQQGPSINAYFGSPPTSSGHHSPPVTVAGEIFAQMYRQVLNGVSQPQQQIYTSNGCVAPDSWMTGTASATSESSIARTPASATSPPRTNTLSHTPNFTSQVPSTPQAYTSSLELSGQAEYSPMLNTLDSQHYQQYQPPNQLEAAPGGFEVSAPDFYEHLEQEPPYETPTYILAAAAVETQDDDYYDVEVEEEEDVDTAPPQDRNFKRQRTLAKILSDNQISVRDLHMRRYDTFLYAGILDRYRVENVANPLKNPATFSVFAHFISATGPSLSIFERHPRSSSLLFNEGGSVPSSQQGLWTYVMPNAALRHQGLLHAMLALASLHIARLQGASSTPSMQHYAWALKRIHKSVSNPQNRLKLTNIAATMLLGFYEIMTADHMKWNMHLSGARQLFVEIDFNSLMRGFQRLKIEKAARGKPYEHGRKRRRRSFEASESPDDHVDLIPDIDENMVSEMFGKEVRYDGFGRVEEPVANIPPEMDVSKFEILQDLYWWYCKQDVIQSIVSGNPLLLDFSRWANCPPRAPLGRSDAVYGSFDHLILLLGRIADFSSRDRARKLKQIELNGGLWRPAPGVDIPRPPQQQHKQPASTTSSAPSGFPGSFAGPGDASMSTPPPMPDFFGMAPPPRANVQMPTPYSSYQKQSATTSQSTISLNAFEGDMPTATMDAIEEHRKIMHALSVFELSLGEHFKPLTSDYQPPMDTPFGPALFYRSYDIGCLWAFYHMAVIIALRAHPHMPPAAHVAAGVAAKQTARYANEIGRIVAGIVPGPPEQPLNPSLGGALCESCLASFFAAVQYQDPLQRHETVVRIFSIARRTGWGSADLIANGCETSWVKAAAAGRGPPYERIVRPHGTSSEDPRLNGSWERLDPNALPDERDEADRRLVKTKAIARLNWAIGVMGGEEDVTSPESGG